ncbi:MAG: RES domain-containing protein [Pseudomonadota bacterium]
MRQDVFHTVTSPADAQNILNGIDRDFLNSTSRFGKALYVSELPDTTLAELSHYNTLGVETIRFEFNISSARILDLTNPKVAEAWGYTGGEISPLTQEIGNSAMWAGYNVIRYLSERGEGVNIAILNDFNKLLRPQMVVPAPNISNMRLMNGVM